MHTELIPGVFEVEDLRIPPRFNIAPYQYAPVVFNDSERGKRKLDLMRWGLVPFWSKEPSTGNRMINARAETVAVKPSFRGPFRYRRCLVPASGFFEWKSTSSGRIPHYFPRKEFPLMGFAGIWDEFTDGENILYTYSIITREANTQLSSYHQRMPVVIEPDDFKEWLAADTPVKEALGLMENCSEMTYDPYPVSRIVNNVRNDSPECVKEYEGEY